MQVANNIPTHNQYVALKSQQWLEEINTWTKNQKMKINEKKTKVMIFNYSTDKQFTTRLTVNDHPVEVINSSRLLGTIITDDLRWDENTAHIVKKENACMELLRKVASIAELKNIYILFVRSQLEHSATVWHSSLTEDNRNDLERVQKSALKLILKEKYKSYDQALNVLDIETLDERREGLCRKFAIRSSKHEKTSKIFPINIKKHHMDTRNPEKFKVQFSRTDRLKNCSVIFMQNALNKQC
jgi:hypothetical protein